MGAKCFSLELKEQVEIIHFLLSSDICLPDRKKRRQNMLNCVILLRARLNYSRLRGVGRRCYSLLTD